MKSKLMLLAGIVALSASATLVGCNKEASTSVPASSTAPVVSLSSVAFQGGPALCYDEPTTNCPEGYGGCSEEEEIKAPRKKQFELVIAAGGSSVADFFSNEAVALELMPDFNESYFAPVKSAILSGNYNFDKTVNGNKVFYLLGPEGHVDHSNPFYAFQYIVVP